HHKRICFDTGHKNTSYHLLQCTDVIKCYYLTSLSLGFCALDKVVCEYL
ncbi:unnamed protein product, partial [Larinioides sclopetarius]